MQAQDKPAAMGKLFLVMGYGVIIALTGLSLWAVGAVQLASRPVSDPVRVWYLIAFVGLELWVCAGLVVVTTKARQGRWSAVMIASALWLVALGLSAVQEKRFHTLFDGKLDAAVAQKLTERANAEARSAELEERLDALEKPTRAVKAIEAELSGYENRSDAENFPTRITALRAELAAAQSYRANEQELANMRAVLEATASLAAERLDARKVGQDFSIFGMRITSDASIWVLIGAMLAIKSLGPWLLVEGLGAEDRSPVAEVEQILEDVGWVHIERTDRQGRVRRVKVPREAA